jgi:hypothetical protein
MPIDGLLSQLHKSAQQAELDYLAGIFFWPIIILSFQKLPKKEIEAKNVKVR